MERENKKLLVAIAIHPVCVQQARPWACTNQLYYNLSLGIPTESCST
jgi:hypothetical protein